MKPKNLLLFLLIFASTILGLGIIESKLSLYRVEGTSMVPTYQQGDILVISPDLDIHPLDVIVYTPLTWNPFHVKFDFTPIVHRVLNEFIRNGTLYFLTKGDAYPPLKVFCDPLTPSYAVLGKVVLRIPWQVLVAIFIALFILILWSYFRSRKTENVSEK